MAYEIERKYLVDTRKLDLAEAFEARQICQGYLLNEKGSNVRIRISGEKAYLTVKGKTEGLRRLEFEYEIPVEDAKAMLGLTDGRLIEKTRYLLDIGGKVWEVDLFEGKNHGLVVAEIELEAEDESFELPEWVQKEVSDDPRYLNSQLLLHPYCEW